MNCMFTSNSEVKRNINVYKRARGASRGYNDEEIIAVS